MLTRLFMLLTLAIGLTACGEDPLYSNLDNKQLKTMLDQGVAIYDIRRPEEWKKTGVIEGSNTLTFVDKNGRLKPEFLPAFSNRISKDQPVILICRTGNRTRALARHLTREMGYTNVYNVKYGISSWIRTGNPVTKI